jgi:hypothetical protein
MVNFRMQVVDLSGGAWALPGAVILEFDSTVLTARYWNEFQVWSKQFG